MYPLDTGLVFDGARSAVLNSSVRKPQSTDSLYFARILTATVAKAGVHGLLYYPEASSERFGRNACVPLRGGHKRDGGNLYHTCLKAIMGTTGNLCLDAVSPLLSGRVGLKATLVVVGGCFRRGQLGSGSRSARSAPPLQRWSGLGTVSPRRVRPCSDPCVRDRYNRSSNASLCTSHIRATRQSGT